MARLLFVCVIAALTLFSFSVAHTEILDSFIKFVNDFRKPYKNDTREFQLRLEYFKVNLQKIERLNQAYGDQESPVFGLTKFSDLSEAEFKEQYLNDLRPKRVPVDTTLRFHGEMRSSQRQHASASLPSKIDWREFGAVSPVKNQASCGACWAFATTETVESAYAITYNTSVPDLAVQQLIDCSDKNFGCAGGDICVAMDYVKAKGITYNKNYPLKDANGTCRPLPVQDKIVKISGYSCNQFVNKEDEMLNILATKGPVAVAVDASTWNNYIGGIIKFHCGNTINHAVEVVGYDLTASVPYYIVRNSWDTDFGLDGYVYIKVGNNLCGIAQSVVNVSIS